MPVILQDRLPFIPWMDPRTARLPGVLPVTDDWLHQDEAFAGQMAARDLLIAGQRGAVHAILPQAQAAAAELLDLVLANLRCNPGYQIGADVVRRPDGVAVPLDRQQPLLTSGRLVQEDLCLMQSQGDEHVLTGAVLCFPASWTLAQKIGKPLSSIHQPVLPYTADIGRRVQRMFNAIRPDQPLWRMNYLCYDDPDLHQPRLETERRPHPQDRVYLRAERQCFVRLAVSQAVVFSIHTYVVRVADLPQDAQDGMAAAGL